MVPHNDDDVRNGAIIGGYQGVQGARGGVFGLLCEDDSSSTRLRPLRAPSAVRGGDEIRAVR